MKTILIILLVVVLTIFLGPIVFKVLSWLFNLLAKGLDILAGALDFFGFNGILS